MASPQVEDGHLKIADDLQLAITQQVFSGLERCVLDAVMMLTYRKGVTKAQISLEDIRLLMGNSDKVRPNRVKTAFERLVNMNVLFVQATKAEPVIGVQKDFDRWEVTMADKMSATKDSSKYIYITKSTLVGADKMSAQEVLLRYVMGKSNVKFTLTSYRVEKGRAKGLLLEATRLTKDPRAAATALKDYFDEIFADDFVKNNVKFPIAYALTRFEAWYKQIPAMPKNIRQEQEASGWRYKYNHKRKDWGRSNERIRPKSPDRGDAEGAEKQSPDAGGGARGATVGN